MDNSAGGYTWHEKCHNILIVTHSSCSMPLSPDFVLVNIASQDNVCAWYRHYYDFMSHHHCNNIYIWAACPDQSCCVIVTVVLYIH